MPCMTALFPTDCVVSTRREKVTLFGFKAEKRDVIWVVGTEATSVFFFIPLHISKSL